MGCGRRGPALGARLNSRMALTEPVRPRSPRWAFSLYLPLLTLLEPHLKFRNGGCNQASWDHSVIDELSGYGVLPDSLYNGTTGYLETVVPRSSERKARSNRENPSHGSRPSINDPSGM